MSFLRVLFILVVCGAMIIPWITTHCSNIPFQGSGVEGPMCIERTLTIPEALQGGSQSTAIIPALIFLAFLIFRVFSLLPPRSGNARITASWIMSRKTSIAIPLENFFSIGGLARKIDP